MHFLLGLISVQGTWREAGGKSRQGGELATLPQNTAAQDGIFLKDSPQRVFLVPYINFMLIDSCHCFHLLKSVSVGSFKATLQDDISNAFYTIFRITIFYSLSLFDGMVITNQPWHFILQKTDFLKAYRLRAIKKLN